MLMASASCYQHKQRNREKKTEKKTRKKRDLIIHIVFQHMMDLERAVVQQSKPKAKASLFSFTIYFYCHARCIFILSPVSRRLLLQYGIITGRFHGDVIKLVNSVVASQSSQPVLYCAVSSPCSNVG